MAAKSSDEYGKRKMSAPKKENISEALGNGDVSLKQLQQPKTYVENTSL
jgi:hypothetical protein